MIMSNPRKMPNTNLDPVQYRRLYERLYYRRVYKAKKILQTRAWQIKNPEKVKVYKKTHKEKTLNLNVGEK